MSSIFLLLLDLKKTDTENVGLAATCSFFGGVDSNW
jgi:hypothetical protein